MVKFTLGNQVSNLKDYQKCQKLVGWLVNDSTVIGIILKQIFRSNVHFSMSKNKYDSEILTLSAENTKGAKVNLAG